MDIDFNKLSENGEVDLTKFSAAQRPVEIKYQNENPYENMEEDFCIFGTDSEPFMIKTKYSAQKIISCPAPLGMSLNHFMAGCKV